MPVVRIKNAFDTLKISARFKSCAYFECIEAFYAPERAITGFRSALDLFQPM